MYSISRVFILFLIFVFFVRLFGLDTSLYGQKKTYHFEHLTSQDGLSSSRILNIYQDSKGFMWFGTYEGINRYDGYKVRSFIHDKQDSNTISNNYINDITEDGNGDIWIATNAGLNKYSCESGKFKKIGLERIEKGSYYDRINYINCLLYKDERLWVGTYGGLFIIDFDTLANKKNDISIDKYFHYDTTQPEYGYHVIRNIKVDNDGVVWVTNYLPCFYKYNPQKENFIEHPVIIPGINQNNQTDFSILHIDENNNFWIKSTDYGFIFWNRKKNIFSQNIPYFNDYIEDFDIKINGVMENNDSILWIGTDGKGLLLYDKKTGDLLHEVQHPADPRSLSSDKITALYQDKQGLMWLGTINSGINIYNPRKSKFNHFYSIACESNSLNNNNVICFEEDQHGHIWIGTDKGISIFNPENNSFIRNVDISPDFSILEQETIIDIMADSQGLVWISAYLQGLLVYHPQNKKLTPFSCKITGIDDSSGDIMKTWRNVQDNFGNIWLSLTNTGLVLFKRNRGQCFLYTSESDNEQSLSHGGIRDMMVDSENKLWLATYHGLSCADLNKVNFNKSYPKVQFQRHLVAKDSNTLNDNRVEVVTEASTGEILIGSESGGLNIYNPHNQSFSYFDKIKGLPANYITGLLEDNSQNIWVTTRKGITKINFSEDHTYTFKMQDGLQSNEFNCAFKSKDGRFYLGGNNGFNAFYPGDILIDSTQVNVYLTQFKIFNQPVKPGEEINGRQILKRKMILTKKIVLTHHENSFSFEFLAIDYYNPSKIQYQYRMKGFDDRWVMAGKNRSASYTNLSPGNYVFQVLSTNAHGIWCDNTKSIELLIMPPWWKTKLAYIFYVIGTALVFILSRYFINKELKLRHNLKAEQQNREQENQIHQLKMRFFTNISHEIRTPLTLISGPFDYLYKTGKAKRWNQDILQQFELIQRNIKRLTTLTNQLLDIRKLESGKMKPEMSTGDIIGFIKNLADGFIPLAQKKNIIFSYEFVPDFYKAGFDHDKLEKIITNLLSNAFKFTPENGQISISAMVDEGDNKKIEISIRDSGKGIEKKHLHNIFNRFYQIDDQNKHKAEGTGIGLSLVKDLVEIHKGSITVNSTPGEGAHFKITLPVVEPGETIPVNKMKEISHSDTESDIKSQKIVNKQYIEEINKDDKDTTILIVEDNVDMRVYMRNILSRQYAVTEAGNGTEGLNIAFKNPPSLIVSDIMMPETDGIEFSRQLKSDLRTSHIPIIILTALTSIDHRIKGLETGADDYITKPFHEEILLLKVKNLLASRDHLRTFLMQQIDLKTEGEKSQKIDIEPSQIQVTDIDTKFIEDISKVVEKNIGNADFGVGKLAGEMKIGNTQLFSKMKGLLNVTPGNFIQQMRMKRAAQLLSSTKYNINEICYMVGFTDPKYFSRCFKNYFGVIPSKYKKAI